jgi:hypothetical protein
MTSEDVSFCLSLIGKPWASGANGPDVFDCWGLLRFIYEKRRGIILTPYQGVATCGQLGLSKQAEMELPRWLQLKKPEHFCGVTLSKNHRVNHVGLWLDEGGGGVLHCNQSSGVIFQALNSLQMSGFTNFNFYTIRP